MRIIGHGIDLVEVSRIEQMIEKHGDRFLERVFTDIERAHSAERKRRAEHLAGRFAAKEAVLKTLGTGWAEGVAWNDIGVVTNASGRPFVQLTGHAAALAMQQGIREWHLSITHTNAHAMASVIAVGD